MSEQLRFIPSALNARMENAKQEIVKIFKVCDHEGKADELLSQLSSAKDSEKIKVAVVGQYTAGKSTIISALTGNNAIKIDADIATTSVENYPWGNILLTDTPGLYTNNQAHDQLAIDTIRKSDLLIYCITSDLFNPYTLNDFKQWAYESGYIGKMFLVINNSNFPQGNVA